jgi:hypothetical protein
MWATTTLEIVELGHQQGAPSRAKRHLSRYGT